MNTGLSAPLPLALMAATALGYAALAGVHTVLSTGSSSSAVRMKRWGGRTAPGAGVWAAEVVLVAVALEGAGTGDWEVVLVLVVLVLVLVAP